MRTTEQKRFVKELSANIAKDICDKIDRGLIPDTWDGHELRRLLADRHAESASMSVARGRGWRSREYANTVRVNNL